MKIGVIVAMDSEYQQLTALLGGSSHGVINGNTIVLNRCGIGKVNAALGTQSFILEHRPDCIISTGVAGGIDGALQVMDVVVAAHTVYHDVWCGDGNAYGQVQGLPARYPAHPLLTESAMAVQPQLPEGITLHMGLTCTGDQFITSRPELDAIKAQFPEGLAVDMESAAIAQTCHIHQVPFLSLRIVSDTPGNTPDHMQQYQNFWSTLGQKAFQVIRQVLQALPQELA